GRLRRWYLRKEPRHGRGYEILHGKRSPGGSSNRNNAPIFGQRPPGEHRIYHELVGRTGIARSLLPLRHDVEPERYAGDRPALHWAPTDGGEVRDVLCERAFLQCGYWAISAAGFGDERFVESASAQPVHV